MNLLGIARHGIGIAGPPPVAVAIARGLALEIVATADPAALAIQAGGSDGEAAWLTTLPGRLRHAPLPPGIVFALRVTNGASTVGSLLVAEREADLGERPGVVVRIGLESVELDRRDGSPGVGVVPRFVGLEAARVGAVRLAALAQGAATVT